MSSSLLDQIRERRKKDSTEENSIESVSPPIEIIESENAICTENIEAFPPPPPMITVTSDTKIKVDHRKDLLASLQNGPTLKKPQALPPKQIPVEIDMMSQILARQQQIKNKEKIQSEVVIPKSTQQVFVTNEKPSVLISECDLIPKWHQKLFKKSIYLCYLTVDQQNFKVTLQGGAFLKDKFKIETELKGIMIDAPGYSLFNKIKFFSEYRELYECILESDHFKKLYFLESEWKMEKSMSFNNWMIELFANYHRVFITSKRYVGNDVLFASRLSEMISKEVLKGALIQETPKESLFFHLILKDVRLAVILIKQLVGSWDHDEIKDLVMRSKNVRGNTVLQVSIEEKQLEMVQFFATYSGDADRFVLDLAYQIHVDKPSDVTKSVIKTLVGKGFQTKRISDFFDLLSNEEMMVLFKNSCEIENPSEFLLQSIKYGNIGIVTELVESVPINAEHLFLATSIVGAFEIVSLLINKGASVSEVNEFGEIPLFNSCRIGDIDAIKLQLEKNSQLVHQKNIYQKGPLGMAVAHSHQAVQEYFSTTYSVSPSECCLFDICDDVFQYLICYLQPNQLLNVKLACRQLYEIADSEPLWQSQCLRRCGFDRVLSCDSWKTMFQVLKSRERIERFKNGSLKCNPILFAGRNFSKNWKNETPVEIIRYLTEESNKSQMLNQRLDITDHNVWISEIEEKSQKLSTCSKVHFLPKDSEWRPISNQEIVSMMLDEGIEESYLPLFFQSCLQSSLDFNTCPILTNSTNLTFYFGVSATKNGDEYMRQKVTGIQWNHYCIITPDYLICLQIRQAIKQKDKISYKTILKPIF